MIFSRSDLVQAKRIVIKVGSSLIASLKGGIDYQFIGRLCSEIAQLHHADKQVVLVSSGAVAAGAAELGLLSRPKDLAKVQAAAAIGQGKLMQTYRDAMKWHNIVVGQVLLTRDGLEMRERFLHARNTLRELLNYKTLPIINENDTVAVDELRLKVGDNDALSVSTATLIEGDCLVILSDVPGLYDRPPQDEHAVLINHVDAITPEILRMGGVSVSGVGTGGMSTKLHAAKAANRAGIPLVVAPGKQPGVLSDIFAGKEIGTFFAPAVRADARRHWIAFSRGISGTIHVDAGAVNALIVDNRSLLPAGVTSIIGDFNVGDSVNIVGPSGAEFARGLVNYSASDIDKIKGLRSGEIGKILGYDIEDCCVIHRDNLLLL